MKIKNWKMKTGVLLSTLILLATATVPNAMAFSVAESGYNADGVSVNIKQIKELADNNLLISDSTPSQALAQTIAAMVSKDPSGNDGHFTEVLDAHDVLHYFYPNHSEKELEGTGISPGQAVEWLNSKGYTATIVDRALTTDEIKERLDNSEPIVTVLENQNSKNWINKHYAGILYVHDDIETGVAENKLHASFIKSINYGEAIINDGEEAQNFQFADMVNSPDPIQAESSFKWVSTITGIKRDPSWINSQTIEGDRANGVFEHKITSDGTQREVRFTDPDVMAMLNMHPIENTEHVMKLSAVALINLYEDKEHQKTVKDLEEFLNISPSTYVTSQNIMDWYEYLGFDFDVVNGRASMSLTKAINDTGRLYLTTFKPQDTANPVKSTATIGAGYSFTSFNGYSPAWFTVKLGENLAPFYDVPLTPEGLAQQQELAKEFKYTNVKRVVSDPFSKTDYEEEKTIYNIRLKGTPDESGITDEPDESVETPPEESNVVPPTSANYTPAEHFNIREIQGQEPWCSQYTNAAAVNTAYKVNEEAITSAKEIMRLKNPGVSDEDLLQMGGGTISNSVEVLQDNYKIATDIEMRTLSFEEVKKEIDAGGIIQIDVYDSESEEAIGTENNLGHAIAIVGYVESKEGNQAPYYIVWNPWWDNTFYWSSEAETFNLGGVKYKWERTWHNWRKNTDSRSSSTIDSDIEEQKVASTPNPYSIQESKNTSLDSGANLGIQTQSHTNSFNFYVNLDILNQNVSNFGSVMSVKNPFSPDIYGFATGKMNNKNALSAVKNGNVKNVYLDGNQAANDFKSAVLSMFVDRNEIANYALSLGVVMAVTIIVGAIPGLNLALPIVTEILAGLLGAVDIYLFLQTCYDYRYDFEDTVASYNKL